MFRQCFLLLLNILCRFENAVYWLWA